VLIDKLEETEKANRLVNVEGKIDVLTGNLEVMEEKLVGLNRFVVDQTAGAVRLLWSMSCALALI
jgi:hypothetical protein